MAGDDSVQVPLTNGENSGQGLAPQEDEHEHYSQRANWLRAAVLGANDGLVTVGALMTGIGTASHDQHQQLLSAVSALVAGALSMAAGEYVSVSQQADTERADVDKERHALDVVPQRELQELVDIWKDRGLSDELARQVAESLTQHDAVRAHARDELNIDIDEHPSPWKAAIASAISFSAGAAIPTVALLLPQHQARFWAMVGAVTAGLAFFGCLGANLGGAPMWKGGVRVLLGGWLAMALTAGVGALFGTSPT